MITVKPALAHHSLQFEKGPGEIGSLPQRGAIEAVKQTHELTLPRRRADEIRHIICKSDEPCSVSLQMCEINKRCAEEFGIVDLAQRT